MAAPKRHDSEAVTLINGIELRVADRWYPSSKLCHKCGCVKADLKLSDRKYVCKCGYHADRDYNARTAALLSHYVPMAQPFILINGISREFTTVECTGTCK